MCNWSWFRSNWNLKNEKLYFCHFQKLLKLSKFFIIYSFHPVVMSFKPFFEVQFFVNFIPVIAHFVPKHRRHCGASRVIVGNMLLLAAANRKENNLNNKNVLSATSLSYSNYSGYCNGIHLYLPWTKSGQYFAARINTIWYWKCDVIAQSA